MGARQRWSDDDGFTLVELFVVVIIIGVLAAIAIAVFLGQREKAQRSSAISSLRNTLTYAVAISQAETTFSDDPARYTEEGGRGIQFTNDPSDEPREVSMATFDSDSVLVLAARGAENCYWIRRAAGAARDEHGHHPVAGTDDCHADDLRHAEAVGW